jgi:hypothetical protein
MLPLDLAVAHLESKNALHESQKPSKTNLLASPAQLRLWWYNTHTLQLAACRSLAHLALSVLLQSNGASHSSVSC